MTRCITKCKRWLKMTITVAIKMTKFFTKWIANVCMHTYVNVFSTSKTFLSTLFKYAYSNKQRMDSYGYICICTWYYRVGHTPSTYIYVLYNYKLLVVYGILHKH